MQRSDFNDPDRIIEIVYNLIRNENSGDVPTTFDVDAMKPEYFKIANYKLQNLTKDSHIKFLGEINSGITLDGKKAESISRFSRSKNGVECLLQIAPYQEKADAKKLEHYLNINMAVKTLLSELAVNKITDSLLVPIFNFDVPGADLAKIDAMKNRVDPKSMYSVQVCEKLHKIVTLGEFLTRNRRDEKVWIEIVRQLVVLLQKINDTFSDFRSNYLIPEVIDCYLQEKNGTIYPKLKLGNFYTSRVGKMIPTAVKRVDVADTPYADLWQFLNYVYQKYDELKEYPKFNSLMGVILPESTRSSDFSLLQSVWDKTSVSTRNSLTFYQILKHPLLQEDANNSVRGDQYMERLRTPVTPKSTVTSDTSDKMTPREGLSKSSENILPMARSKKSKSNQRTRSKEWHGHRTIASGSSVSSSTHSNNRDYDTEFMDDLDQMARMPQAQGVMYPQQSQTMGNAMMNALGAPQQPQSSSQGQYSMYNTINADGSNLGQIFPNQAQNMGMHQPSFNFGGQNGYLMPQSQQNMSSMMGPQSGMMDPMYQQQFIQAMQSSQPGFDPNMMMGGGAGRRPHFHK